jgi:hypothetical protein
MRQWLSNLDRLLRGDATRPDSLRDATIQTETSGLMVLIVLLGAIYGLCMGSYSLLKEIPDSVVDPNGRYLQLLATTVKVPALFYLTLLITFPSLYVFNALVGSRLTVVSVLRLLIASLAVNLAVLSSLGPIVLFFSLSTKSYPFILLLNVAVFSVAGALGLSFLLQTLHRLTKSRADAESGESGAVGSSSPKNAETPDETGAPADEPCALDMPEGQVLGRHTRLVFSCWVVVFALVGAQMGWVLRPFVGNPNLPFTWFRERHSNFFEAVLRTLGALLTGAD